MRPNEGAKKVLWGAPCVYDDRDVLLSVLIGRGETVIN